MAEDHAADGDDWDALATALLDRTFEAVREGADPSPRGTVGPIFRALGSGADELAGEHLGIVDSALGSGDGGEGSGAGETHASVLDLAAGAGGLLVRLADRYDRAVGLVADGDLARIAAGRSGAPVVLGALPDPPVYGPFDAVVGLGYPTAALTGDGDPERALEAIREVLSPGGTVVLDAAVEPGALLGDRWQEPVGGYRIDRTVGAGDVSGDLGRMGIEYELERVADGAVAETIEHVTVRLFDPGELRDLLTAAGFEDVTVEGKPGEPDALVAVARKPE